MAVAQKEIERALPDARFEALLLDFIAYLEFERGLARNTLSAYRTDLLQYGSFLAERDLDATEVEAADVADFLAGLARGEGRPAASAATLNRKTACLRSFIQTFTSNGAYSFVERPRQTKPAFQPSKT